MDFDSLEKRQTEPLYRPKLEQLTFNSDIIDENDPKLQSIDTEDATDTIPEQKKMLIELHQNKFDNF